MKSLPFHDLGRSVDYMGLFGLQSTLCEQTVKILLCNMCVRPLITSPLTFIKLNQDDRCSYMGQYNVKFTPPQF